MLLRSLWDRKNMKQLKRIGIILVSALLPGIVVLGASTAVAGQPQTAIEESICNPIGPQLNLNIHGKYPFSFSDEKVLPDEKSIFRDEYSGSTMQHITNKGSTVTDPTIFEPYTESFNDASHDSSPKLMLSCVEEEFYMVGKVRAKSNKEQSFSHAGFPLLFPNLVIETYTDTYPADTHFLVHKEYPDDLMPAPGLSSIRNLYNATPEGFVKFESTTSEEEKPLGIKSLFKWLGWLCRTIFLDTNEDGDIDAYGVAFVTTD